MPTLPSRRTQPFHWGIPGIAALAVGVLIVTAACQTPHGNLPAGSTPATAASQPTASTYPVKVYFSRHPESDGNPGVVFPVQRVSPTLGVATYAISQLIAGPTAAESAAGYYTTLGGWQPGASNCGGADFTLTLNREGTTPEPGTATLQFCRTVLLGGDLSGLRISVEIDATLLQFATIHKVVILTPQGNCFDDFSGLNLCLDSSLVRVYFSKQPDSFNDPTAVFPVQRIAPSPDDATYAIQQLIAGPTTAEHGAGYFTELTAALSGPSNCGGADFTLTLNMRGTTPQAGTAALQFCRATMLPGDLTGPRIAAEIDKTLTQFPDITAVVILTQAGHCFDNLSGGDRCLR